tara:strand:+ start:8023 stop:9096 length:1074 start_codon:yes stop_codon:yes gene_type:complete
MKIGLFGFFGVGAFADDIIRDATVLALTEAANALGTTVEFTDQLSPHNVKTLDLLVVCSGSYLGPSRIWPATELATGALDIPVALYGTGYRKEKEPLDRDSVMRTKALIMKAYFATVRGQMSKSMLVSNDIPVNGIYDVGDTGILISDVVPDANLITTMLPERYIAGNARCMPENEAKLVCNGMAWDFLAECYDAAIEQTDMDVVFVPLRIRPNDNDAEGIAQVITRMKHVDRTIVVPSRDAGRAFAIIRGASLVFGQRLHHSIGGMSMDIPTVPMEYQFGKMEDFMSSLIDWEDPGARHLTVGDVKHRNTSKFLELLDCIWDDDPTIADAVMRLKSNVRSHARLILEKLPHPYTYK